MFNKRIKMFAQKMMSPDKPGEMSGKKIEDADFLGLTGAETPIEQRVSRLLSSMALSEKIDLCSGYDSLAIRAIPRVGLPSVWSSDASSGIRSFDTATAFPAPIALAASWDRTLVKECASAIAEEARAKGISILLGPGVNIHRVPTCGRNFEYFGEDPYLASEIVVPYIEGVQSKGVITTVKHFACNNSDFDRHRNNASVDERTLREIYLPAFKAAVTQAKTGSVMSAYNPINGVYASENKMLLTNILRDEWGFDGFVISDWISTYSTEGPIKAGLDLEMPNGKWINVKMVKKAIENGTIAPEDIDRMAGNILRTLFKFGIYDRAPIDTSCKPHSPEHTHLSTEAAKESITLLKNDKILPLNQEKITTIAVVGPLAKDTPIGGGGSCLVISPSSQTDILTGVQNASGDISVIYIESKEGEILSEGKHLLKKADIVLLCLGYSNIEESETYDKMWRLPNFQEKLIRNTARINSNIVSLLLSGSACEIDSWLPAVKGLFLCYFPGQSGGNAIASLLFGETNPSGKLPFTIAKQFADYKSNENYVKHPERTSFRQIMGPKRVLKKAKKQMKTFEYKEGLFVGYRQFDTEKLEPLFPFGFGLSYTTFEFSDLNITPDSGGLKETVSVSCSVRNTGKMAGSEVIQLYVKDNESSLPRPEKELKGFEKINLEPQEAKTVTFNLNKEAFSFYDNRLPGWTIEPGDFTIAVGNSSGNILVSGSVSKKAE